LPNFAVDAAKFVKKVRVMATNATTELKGNLGPGFENLQPTDLNPKTFLKKQVTDLLDDKPAAVAAPTVKLDPDLL
jgi:sec-independent protein translocase protein TatB